jgi:Protein of unknown function (DUF3987)
VLGPVLGPATSLIRKIIQAPDALCGSSVLAASHLAFQAHADVVVDGRVSPLSEAFLSVGLTGERKSAVDDAALWPHRKHERVLFDKHEVDKVTYQYDREAYDKARQEAVGRKRSRTVDEKRRALHDLGPPPAPPISPFLLCEDPTFQGLVKLLAVGQPSMGLFSDEGGMFIGGYGARKI